MACQQHSPPHFNRVPGGMNSVSLRAFPSCPSYPSAYLAYLGSWGSEKYFLASPMAFPVSYAVCYAVAGSWGSMMVKRFQPFMCISVSIYCVNTNELIWIMLENYSRHKLLIAKGIAGQAASIMTPWIPLSFLPSK